MKHSVNGYKANESFSGSIDISIGDPVTAAYIVDTFRQKAKPCLTADEYDKAEILLSIARQIEDEIEVVFKDE